MNLSIYNEIAKIARRAFEFIKIQPGQYNAAQILSALKKCEAAWDDQSPEYYTLEDAAAVAVGSFSCEFKIKDSFRILAKVATAWNIPTPARTLFERKKEAAPAVAAFDMPAAVGTVKKAIDKKAPQCSNLRFAYVDNARRALVGCNGYLMAVAALPSLNVADTDRASFLIDSSLLKAGRVVIDANEKATNGPAVADSPVGHYPNWRACFPKTYDTDGVKFDKKTAAALKKAVAAAAKHSDTIEAKQGKIKIVSIYGEANTNKIIVRARKTDNVLNNGSWNEIITYQNFNVTTPDTLQRSFSFCFNAIQFAALPAFDTLYFPANGRPMITSGKTAVCLLMPCEPPENWEAPNNANYYYDESDTDGTPDTAPTTAPTAPTAQGGTLPGLSAAACVYLPIL